MAKSRTVKASGSGILVTVGFKELIAKIEKAQGDTEAAIFEAAKAGGRAMYSELVNEAKKSNVPDDIVDEIRFQAERDGSGNRVGVKVGWRMPENIDYKNLSAGQKAALLNYGTPSRHTKSGQSRGWIDARNFIRRAKRKARPKVKEEEKKALAKIVRELK